MAKVDEDIEFDRLIQDKRYKELIGVLTKVLDKLDTLNKEDTKDSMERLLSKVGEITPAIKVLAKVIIEQLKPKNKEWYFEITRNSQGYITEIIAK
jgi:hypothetical protein